MKFEKIREDTFQTIQTGAGILLSAFNVEEASYEKTDMLGTTSGGISFTATPSFIDYGEDLDNCPKNMKELKRLDEWEVVASGSFKTIDTPLAKRLTALADVSGNKITPRNSLSQDDFGDIWIVADYGVNDGFVAIHILNALSTGGFSMQTTDREKGEFAFEFTGHYSMNAQDTVPFEIYVNRNESAGE